MNYAELTDDELRLEVAKRCGYRWYGVDKEAWLAMPGRTGLLPCGVVEIDNPSDGDELHIKSPNYPHDLTAAIALLESTVAEYNFGKRITGTPKPVYDVIIWGYYSAFGDDYEATADTLPRAACEAWLMWKDARKEAQHDKG